MWNILCNIFYLLIQNIEGYSKQKMAKSVFVQKLEAEDAQSDLDVCTLKVAGKKVGGTFF